MVDSTVENAVSIENVDENIIDSPSRDESICESAPSSVDEVLDSNGIAEDNSSEIDEGDKQNTALDSKKKDNKFVAFMKAHFNKKNSNRIWEIDFLRGFCVFLMLFDHAAFALLDIFGPAWYGGALAMQQSQEFGAKLCALCLKYWYSPLREIGHPTVLFIFFSISGISCSFSRSNLKRGLILAVVSALYTLVTYLIDTFIASGMLVSFGVLHFYAVCILTWAIICIIIKNNTVAKTIISGFLVILVAVLYFCYKAPATTPNGFFWLWPRENFDGTPGALRFYQNTVSPGDLFTIIPYASFFFAGTFLQPLLYSKRRSLLPALDRGWHRPITFLGRHGIVVYLTHIVLVTFILCMFSLIFYGVWGLF